MIKKMIVGTLLLMSMVAYGSADRYLDGQYIRNGANTLTIPAANDTLVGRATNESLTNKTIDGDLNTVQDLPVSAIKGSALSGTNSGDVTAAAMGSTPNANGFTLTGQALNLEPADATHPGALTATDWSTFNGKFTSPMTTLGDVIYGGTAGAGTRLAGNTTTTKQFLSQTGDGGNSAAPVWSVVSKSDVGLSNVTNDAQVTKAEYTAKGDILVGTGAGAYSPLGIGTNGYVIMADSTGGGGTVGVKWAAIPATAPSITGSRGTPTAITAVGGVAFTGTYYKNIWFIAGDGGVIDITANPQIAAGTNVGQELTLIGRDGTNTVKFEDGTGLSLNGVWIAGLDSVLILVWDGSAWVETSRR